ncbi:hypothetical protein [Primorskyibacter sp. S87]|uniref:hypothetical protein n=1 Tax=Primorskyibacter sp. S87 TaxID=3415126 RepID=UPI003C7AA894
MNNIIAFKNQNATRNVVAKTDQADNVISLDDWRSGSHPVRTCNGVFFVSNVWGTSGDAA